MDVVNAECNNLCQALQQQFNALDSLGSLLERVSCDVARLEAAVEAAELQLLGEQQPLAHRILQPVIRVSYAIRVYTAVLHYYVCLLMSKC